MLRFAVALAAVLAGCAAGQPPIPVHGDDFERDCRVKNAGQFIGRPRISQTGAEILKATGSGVIRWVPFGAAVTMDYRTDRVTVRLGRDGRIVGVSCG